MKTKPILLFLALLSGALYSFAQAGAASATASVALGQPVNISVTVQGTPPFTYQWTKNGATIPGATNALLVFPAVALADVGTYAVTIANSAGSTTSNNGVLSVTLIPPAGAMLTFTPGVLPPAGAAK